MSTGLRERPAQAAANGGLAARRAVIRWAWRMFRRFASYGNVIGYAILLIAFFENDVYRTALGLVLLAIVVRYLPPNS